jgi:CO dehydrogenase/acetyl-CoA synthase epsilon subunit
MPSSKFQLLSKLKALIECENVNGMRQEGRTQDLCLFEGCIMHHGCQGKSGLSTGSLFP